MNGIQTASPHRLLLCSAFPCRPAHRFGGLPALDRHLLRPSALGSLCWRRSGWSAGVSCRAAVLSRRRCRRQSGAAPSRHRFCRVACPVAWFFRSSPRFRSASLFLPCYALWRSASIHRSASAFSSCRFCFPLGLYWWVAQSAPLVLSLLRFVRLRHPPHCLTTRSSERRLAAGLSRTFTLDFASLRR